MGQDPTTLFPYHADLVTGDGSDRVAAFREAVRSTVGDSPHDNLHVVEGRELTDAARLTTGVLGDRVGFS